MDINIKDIETLIKKKESNILEFKKSTVQLKPAFETLCAFLNNSGGTILIGVNDKGHIVGQDVSDNTYQEIAKETRKLEPEANIDIQYLNTPKEKTLIAIQVEPGKHAPYTYDGRAFQRHQSTTSRMSQHLYEQLIVKRGQLNHDWEDVVATEYSLQELDHEEIYRTLKEGISEKRIPPSAEKEEIDKILRQLDLMTEDQPKRAAVALFANHIKSSYTQCWLKMARFNGTDKSSDFIDNQQIHCNIFRMLED